MKTLKFFIFCMFTTCLFGQITVTTLTSPISGSGGLSLDTDGNLYIGDFGDMLGGPDTDGNPNNILKLDTDLNLSIFASGFIGASGNGFDSNGVLFQSDIRDNAIYKIINGVRTFVTSDGIVSPVGIVFDSNDNFYVCNCGNGTIQKITPGGISTVFASGSLFACPNGITVDEEDNLYVSNFSNTNIVKITPSGTATTIANTQVGDTNGHLDYDEISRNLYIASYAGQKIYSLNIDDPQIEVLVGTGVRGNTDGDADTATFSTPNGVAVSQTGDSIYVNCAVPLSGTIINPQVVRLISGVTLSIEENARTKYQVKTYPSPATNEITIQATLPFHISKVTLAIYDLQGKLMTEEKLTLDSNLNANIQISNLLSGSYLYTVSHESKQLFNGRFIKK